MPQIGVYNKKCSVFLREVCQAIIDRDPFRCCSSGSDGILEHRRDKVGAIERSIGKIGDFTMDPGISSAGCPVFSSSGLSFDRHRVFHCRKENECVYLPFYQINISISASMHCSHPPYDAFSASI
jgi:hypothetical protein